VHGGGSWSPPDGEGSAGSTFSIINEAYCTLQNDDYWENSENVVKTPQNPTINPTITQSNTHSEKLHVSHNANPDNNQTAGTSKIYTAKTNSNKQNLQKFHKNKSEDSTQSNQTPTETNLERSHTYETQNTHKRTTTKLFYNETDEGPYVVYIERFSNQIDIANADAASNGNKSKQNIGKLHPMSTGKMIFDNHIGIRQNIKEISAIGKNKIKIECADGRSANVLLKSKFFTENSYDVYIPQYLMRRRGVVRGVPLEFSCEFFKRPN